MSDRVTDHLTDLQRQLDALTREVREDQSWRRNFKRSIERQSGQIEKLLEGLKDEKEVRKQDADLVACRGESPPPRLAQISLGTRRGRDPDVLLKPHARYVDVGAAATPPRPSLFRALLALVRLA